LDVCIPTCKIIEGCVTAFKTQLSSSFFNVNFITGQNEREETTQNTTVTKSAACNATTKKRILLLVRMKEILFISEREETTQNTTVTKSAACASYKSNYVTYITATYTRATLSRQPARNCPQQQFWRVI
jgi:hypothetical protein